MLNNQGEKNFLVSTEIRCQNAETVVADQLHLWVTALMTANLRSSQYKSGTAQMSLRVLQPRFPLLKGGISNQETTSYPHSTVQS